MRIVGRTLLKPLITLLIGGCAHGALACDQYVCAPQDPFRATVTHGNFTNLYLYPDPETETWDKHLAGLGHPIFSISSLDNLVAGLVDSSYFLLATQYHQIEPPAFSGHQTTASSCIAPVVAYANAHGNQLSYATLGDFVACEVNAGGNKSDQVNVILSPEYTAQNDVSFQLPTGQTFTFASPPVACGPGSNTHAFHTAKLGVPNFTVVPIQCNLNTDGSGVDSLDSMSEGLSHEMLETISDPAGAGYVHIPGGGDQFVAAVTNSSDFNDGELADICEPGGPQNPNGDDSLAYVAMPLVTFSPSQRFNAQLMQGLHMGRYWSNVDNSCQPQFLMSDKLVDDASPPRMGTGGGMTAQVQYFQPFTKFSTLAPSVQLQRGLQQMMLYTHTHDDNLCNQSDLSVTLNFTNATRRAPITLDHLNQVQNAGSWDNEETHVVNLAVPAGLTLGDIAAVTLNVNSGHCNALAGLDGWNPDHFIVFAALAPPPPPNNGAAPVLTVSTPESLFRPTLSAPQAQVVAGQKLAIAGLNFPTTPSNQALLQWTPNASGLLTNSTLFGLPHGDQSTIARTPLSPGFYSVANIAPSTAYSFSVQDCNDFACTAVSNTVDYKSSATNSPPPATLTLVEGTKKVVLTTIAAVNGAFTAEVTIPAGTALGAHVVQATENGALIASLPLAIVAAGQHDPTLGFVDPTTGVIQASTRVAVGNSVAVRGEGFAAGAVRLTLDTATGTSLATSTAAGSPPVFNASFKMNASGDHKIVASQTTGTTSLTATADITAQSIQ